MLPSTFNTRIDVQGIQLDERSERHLWSGLERLEVFTRSRGDRHCHVHLGRDHRFGIGVRITLVVPGRTVVAEDSAPHPLAAVDGALRKLKRQLRELKGLRTSWLRSRAAARAPAPEPVEAPPRSTVEASVPGLRGEIRELLAATAQHHRMMLEVDDLVDETVMEVLEHLDEKPRSIGIAEWMHLVGHDVLDRAVHEDAVATVDVAKSEPEPVQDDAGEGPFGEPAWRFDLRTDLGAAGRMHVVGPRVLDPAEEAEVADLGARAWSLLGDLPRPWREAFRWRSVDDLTPEEIARRQGRSVPEVDRDLDRAQAFLRSHLAGTPASAE